MLSLMSIEHVTVHLLRPVSIRRRLQAWREKFFVSLFSFMRGARSLAPLCFSNFFRRSCKISLLKNGFVTLFLIRFLYFQKITLDSSRIGRCKICALIFGVS